MTLVYAHALLMLNLSIHSWMRDVENNHRAYWIAWNLVLVYGIEEPYLGTSVSPIVHAFLLRNNNIVEKLKETCFYLVNRLYRKALIISTSDGKSHPKKKKVNWLFPNLQSRDIRRARRVCGNSQQQQQQPWRQRCDRFFYFSLTIFTGISILEGANDDVFLDYFSWAAWQIWSYSQKPRRRQELLFWRQGKQTG